MIPVLLVAGSLLQMKSYFEPNSVLICSSMLCVGGLMIQKNLPQSSFYSFFLFRGVTVWMIGFLLYANGLGAIGHFVAE